MTGATSPSADRLRAELGGRGKAPAAAASSLDDIVALGPRAALAAQRDRAPGYLSSTCRRRIYRWIWDDAAARTGATVAEVAGGFLELRRGPATMRVYEQLVPLDDPVTLRFAGDKPASHAALLAAGLRVPEHLDLAVDEIDAAYEFVTAHGPCVVKPARGGGSGHGVTGGVRTRGDLLRARLRAARWDPARLLVEEQVVGAEHRVLVLDGEVLGTVRRHPPEVVGDGRSTVLDLILAENDRRARAGGTAGIVGLRPSLDTVFALRERQLRLSSVPPAGVRVVVATTTSAASERDAETVSTRSLHDTAQRAAQAVGARLASVELIVADAGGRPEPTVIEVNTTPGLAHHYLVRDPATVVPVAARVAESVIGGRISEPVRHAR